MAFLAYFAQAGVFKEVSGRLVNFVLVITQFQVHMSFLMVGHTHEDID